MLVKGDLQKVINGLKHACCTQTPEHYLDAQGRPLPITKELALQKQNNDKNFEALMIAGVVLLNSEGLLPYDLDSGLLDVLDKQSMPTIYSYERVREGLFALWDSYHGLGEIIAGLPNIPPRTEIFLRGVKNVKPQVVALEFTRDNGQKAIDMYRLDMISRETLNDRLCDDHVSSFLFDDYSRLIDYCKANDIKITCVAPNKADYMQPETFFPEANPLKEKARAATNLIEQALWEWRYCEELSKLQDKVIAPAVSEATKLGKTLLIFGAAHRPSLLQLLNP
jgi:hypothetical protein